MITGQDTVVVLAGDPAAVVRRFLDAWSERWPGLRVAVGVDDSAPFEPWAGGMVATGREEILVARDEDMEVFWDEHGYALDATGEGPFAIYYSPYGPRSSKVLALEDPYNHGDGFAYEPYEMLVAGRGMSLLTLVTPDEAKEFSATLLDALLDQIPEPD
ncbi:hypothetical protein [Actinoplanes sp. TFC3]|uniref:hypothetical protein n=1 Tax=Actinoplanes sp. TFC3 TaxID=1710355 RepID=UPI00083758CB|nr:hypothetical protein [Actinoplanes sp. TFC3]